MKWIKGKQQRKVTNTNQIYDKEFYLVYIKANQQQYRRFEQYKLNNKNFPINIHRILKLISTNYEFF